MDRIDVICPKCGHLHHTSPGNVGRKVRCAKCDHVFRMEAASKPNTTAALREALPSPAPAVKHQAVPDWKAGDVLLDLYEVLKFRDDDPDDKDLFRKGGMGRVYRVRHRDSDKDAAMKVPLPEKFQTESQRKDFFGECETLCRLEPHLHTVTCYHVSPLDGQDGLPLLFTEYVAGGDLNDWLKAGRLDDRKTALDVAIQIARGMAFAHGKGLIHRDLKPQNVLMTPDGIAKVADFGLARNGTTTGEVVEGALAAVSVSTGAGTAGYAAPEQCSAGTRVDGRADIFAFGVLLWRLLGGRLSWIQQVEPKDRLRKSIVAKHAVSMLLKRGETKVPPHLAETILRCLEPEPTERWDAFPPLIERLKAAYQELTGKLYLKTAPVGTRSPADEMNNRGVSLAHLGRAEDAEACFKSALEIQPGHRAATYNRGLLLWRGLRISEQAFRHTLDKLSKSDTAPWESAWRLGQFQLERGSVEAAVSLLEEGIRLGGDGRVVRTLEQARSVPPTPPPSSGRCVRICEGHQAAVTSVALSADGRWALSGGADHTLRLWEVAKGKCVRTLTGHQGRVSSVGLSWDASCAISGSDDGTLRFWDVSRGTCLWTRKDHGEAVTCVALSPDGNWAVSGSARTLCLRELATGRSPFAYAEHGAAATAVSWSSDGRYLLSGSADATLRLWERVSGRCLLTLSGHKGPVNSVCFSPDGERAVSGSEDKSVRLWDAQSGKCLRVLAAHATAVSSVSCSSDGRWVLSGGHDRTLRRWALVRGQCLERYTGHAGLVTSACLTNDGSTAISASADKTLRVWQIEDLRADSTPRVHFMLCEITSVDALASAETEHRHLLAEACRAAERGDFRMARGHLDRARQMHGCGDSAEAKSVGAAIDQTEHRHLLAEARGAGEQGDFTGAWGHLDQARQVRGCIDSIEAKSVEAWIGQTEHRHLLAEARGAAERGDFTGAWGHLDQARQVRGCVDLIEAKSVEAWIGQTEQSHLLVKARGAAEPGDFRRAWRYLDQAFQVRGCANSTNAKWVEAWIGQTEQSHLLVNARGAAERGDFRRAWRYLDQAFQVRGCADSTKAKSLAESIVQRRPELAVWSSWPFLASEASWRQALISAAFRQPVDFTNSIGMKFNLIPAGTFLMGASDTDQDAGSDEKPRHLVRITRPFYLGVYPVTQSQYAAVIGRYPSHFRGDGNRPVEQVSWEEAMVFCQKLTEALRGEGGVGTFRLPTEAEREYACRAGMNTRYCFGDDAAELADYAWYNNNSGRTTHPVGQKKPNAWGLYDMHGNVREWCQDWYDAVYYAGCPTEDPSGLSIASDRVARGGSWSSVASFCRASRRAGRGPGFRSHDLGFRLLKTVF